MSEGNRSQALAHLIKRPYYQVKGSRVQDSFCHLQGTTSPVQKKICWCLFLSLFPFSLNFFPTTYNRKKKKGKKNNHYGSVLASTLITVLSLAAIKINKQRGGQMWNKDTWTYTSLESFRNLLIEMTQNKVRENSIFGVRKNRVQSPSLSSCIYTRGKLFNSSNH